MCPSPQSAPISAACSKRALAADDGRHRHDVIGIGGVPHPEKKSQQHDGEQCWSSSTVLSDRQAEWELASAHSSARSRVRQSDSCSIGRVISEAERARNRTTQPPRESRLTPPRTCGSGIEFRIHGGGHSQPVLESIRKKPMHTI